MDTFKPYSDDENEPNLIDTTIEPEMKIYGHDICEDNKTNENIECVACCKCFTTKYSLRRHEERSPVCLKWISIKPEKTEESFNFIDYITDLKRNAICSNDMENTCKHCYANFSNIGNLNKHFKTSIICNQLALYEFLKDIKKL